MSPTPIGKPPQPLPQPIPLGGQFTFGDQPLAGDRAPAFCDRHATSQLRKKLPEGRVTQCKMCDQSLHTSYVDFALCPICSNRERACMICGSAARALREATAGVLNRAPAPAPVPKSMGDMEHVASTASLSFNHDSHRGDGRTGSPARGRRPPQHPGALSGRGPNTGRGGPPPGSLRYDGPSGAPVPPHPRPPVQRRQTPPPVDRSKSSDGPHRLTSAAYPWAPSTPGQQFSSQIGSSPCPAWGTAVATPRGSQPRSPRSYGDFGHCGSFVPLSAPPPPPGAPHPFTPVRGKSNEGPQRLTSAAYPWAPSTPGQQWFPRMLAC